MLQDKYNAFDTKDRYLFRFTWVALVVYGFIHDFGLKSWLLSAAAIAVLSLVIGMIAFALRLSENARFFTYSVGYLIGLTFTLGILS